MSNRPYNDPIRLRGIAVALGGLFQKRCKCDATLCPLCGSCTIEGNGCDCGVRGILAWIDDAMRES